MGLAGAGFGASRAVQAERERRLREFQVMENARIAQEELNRRVAEDQARQQMALKELDLADLRRRDQNNERGMKLMADDKAAMDTDAAMAALPSHLKPLEGLIRVGLAKVSPADLEDPTARSARLAKEHEQGVQDQIRIRQAGRAPHAPHVPEQIFVKRGDQVIPIPKGTAQPGDTPYDPVAARSSQPANKEEALDTAREARRLAVALRGHKGLGGAFGVMDQYLPTLRQGTADAVAIRDALTSLLTLENTGKLKGVLSNTDMQILRQASTTLSPGMSEAAAKQELKRIAQVMSKVTGEEDPYANEDQPNGVAAVDPRVLELMKKYGGGG